MKCERCKIPDGSPAVCVHVAGAKGGQALRDRRLAEDPDYFKKLGTKGGARVKEVMGEGFFEEIGKKGGAKVREMFGREHFEEIGKKGGDKTLAEHGRLHYQKMGTKGGAVVKAAFDALKDKERRS